MQKLERLQALVNEWSACKKCPLLYPERTQVVFGYGQFEKPPIYDRDTGRQLGFGGQIMIIGEAPGANEDEQGIPFVGKSGMLLNQYLASISVRPEVKEAQTELRKASQNRVQEMDFKLRALLCQEFFFTNVIACHPPENRDPTPAEVAACRPRLTETIYIVDPVVIIAVGRTAVESLVHHKVSITNVRGQLFDVKIPGRFLGQELVYPLIATLHPSYLMRKNDFNQKEGEGAKTFRDFLHAAKLVDDYNFRHFGIVHPVRKEEDD